MTFKELLEQELNPATLAAEIANLDKTAKATYNIVNDLQKSPDLQKAITPFQQLVNQQLQQKKMQAQQLDLQKKQQQNVQQAQQRQANTPVLKTGTAVAPNVNANSANMQQ